MEFLSYFMFYIGVNTLIAIAALLLQEVARRAVNVR
jgi:uncharacterized membrane protein